MPFLNLKFELTVAGEMDSRRAREKLAAAKAAWAEAARTNGEALNIDEFLSFTHPESSHSLLAQTGRKYFLRLLILVHKMANAELVIAP